MKVKYKRISVIEIAKLIKESDVLSIEYLGEDIEFHENTDRIKKSITGIELRFSKKHP